MLAGGGPDLVALVNNDVTVEPGWLTPLVEALAADDTLGATCPKVRFATRYVEVGLSAETHRRGRGDARDLGVRVRRVRRTDGTDVTERVQRVDGFHGFEPAPGAPHAQWTKASSTLRVPEMGDGDAVELELDADAARSVVVTSGGRETVLAGVGPVPAWYRVPAAGTPVEVINNVGTVLTADGYGADRGWLEEDRGQYETAEDVFAWCGAAVLLRGEYLRDVGGFDERLFLYYEDLELAWRGARRGWRYRYVPASVVRHVHSATAVEGSDLAQRRNERNRLLVLTRHAGPGRAARAVGRHVLVTGSYTRRDVVAPLLRGAPPRARVVANRLAALAGFARHAPGFAPKTSRREASEASGAGGEPTRRVGSRVSRPPRRADQRFWRR